LPGWWRGYAKVDFVPRATQLAAVLRIPISNAMMGGIYTIRISIGRGVEPLNLLLDTGSSMLVVTGYDPAADADAVTTRLLQSGQFMSGKFLAAVVHAPVRLEVTAGGAGVTVPGANLAVAYDAPPGVFGMADGILGMAYAALNVASQMPADTWKTRYKADQLGLGTQSQLDPFIQQAAAAGLTGERFGLAVQRAMTSLALPKPETDPLNNGLFILGGGMDCTDLYTGAVTSIAVVNKHFYNTNLLTVRIGHQSADVRPAVAKGDVVSNSILDSGSSVLRLDQSLYTRIIAMFRAINPDFATALGNFGPDASSGCDQRQIDLTKWPPIEFVFQGGDGNPASIAVPPQSYWQFDSAGKGMALAALSGDNGVLGGQSNFGLPIFCGNFVVFDRTARNGQGMVSFAKSPPSPAEALVA
jgi:hypothetical protein